MSASFILSVITFDRPVEVDVCARDREGIAKAITNIMDPKMVFILR
tara:strand:- start:88062 stop:88199 length:138 start_codon:yes stop_codon:yes gene_type:complete